MTSKVLLRGGCVLTLGSKSPNFASADVLIDEGRIAEVGPGLRARDAETVDATDTIVMPGFVDTHRHARKALFRNLGETDPANIDDASPAAEHYGPDDVYAATLASLLGAAEAGITTVVDWSGGEAGDGSAESALQAHADAGSRTVFVAVPSSSTYRDGAPGTDARHLVEHLAELAGPMTTLAYGSVVTSSADLAALQTARHDAAELGLRFVAHPGPGSWDPGLISQVVQGPVGQGITLLHPPDLDDAELDALASSGAAVSLAPSSDMAAGRGSPPIQLLIDREIRPGLAVDDERVAPGDMFAQMRATISLQHATVFDRKLAGKAGVPRLMTTRDVIRSATVDGAPAAGLGGSIGSLVPGMFADVIVLRTDRPNVFPINDPIGAVVWGMDTSNVDSVFVGGRALMRDGVLDADIQRVRDLAKDARDRVATAAGLVGTAAPGADR